MISIKGNDENVDAIAGGRLPRGLRFLANARLETVGDYEHRASVRETA